ncbi:MAG TPA: Fe-S cluster assembly protein SufD [Ruminococcaceae bacterium]|jgi:Fe-S cluster assembly scaffold protein SufB|nr:Fe-S cluster assembly protein SufD [Oscillospiraceae bacterium]
MNMTLKQVNALPVRTWNWLGVNGTPLEGDVPESFPRAEGKITLPDSVSSAAHPFEGAGIIRTGMGPEAERFVLKKKNAGYDLEAGPGVKAEEPVLIEYRLGPSCPALSDCNTILARENSELTVVMQYASDGESPVFHGGVTKILAEKNAVVHLIQVQLLNDSAVHFDDVGILTREGAFVEVIHAELGGSKAFAGCKARLEGRRSRLGTETIYLGENSRELDMNYVAEHIGRETESEMHANGALMDESQKIYRGTIDFQLGASRSVGHESEYTLLFSPNVRNRTAPLILCNEEDVEGQHAASIGKIDPHKLFYLMTRGLSEAEAKRIVIEAQFTPALEKIPSEELRQTVLEWLKERMDRNETIG